MILCGPPAELVPDLLLAVGVAEVHVADHQHPVHHHHHRDDPAVQYSTVQS